MRENSRFEKYFKKSEEHKYLSEDFNTIIMVIILNSLGFFFLEFTTSYVAASVFKVTHAKLGLMFSAWAIGNIISAPLAGVLTDKYSKKKLIAIGSFGRGASYFIIYAGILSRSYSLYISGWIIIGFAVGFFWVPLNALIAEKSHKNHRSYAYSRRYLGSGIGTVIGGALGFLVFTSTIKKAPGRFDIAFSCLIIYGIMNWIAGILFLKKVDDTVHYQYVETESLENNIKDINNGKNEKKVDGKREFPTSNKTNGTKLQGRLLIGLIIFIILILFSAINGSIAKPFTQIYLMKFIVENESDVMLIYLPAGIVSPLIAPFLGKSVDKIDPKFGIIILSIFGALLTFLLISTYNPYLFALILVLDVAISNSTDYLLKNLASRISKSKRGKIFGVLDVASIIGRFIGPLLGGIVIASSGYRTPFIISIFVELSLIFIYIIAINILKNELEEI